MLELADQMMQEIRKTSDVIKDNMDWTELRSMISGTYGHNIY